MISLCYLLQMNDQTYQIIGAALEVHKELGCGFLEPVYQEALELDLTDRKIPFCAQAEMPVYYKGRICEICGSSILPKLRVKREFLDRR